MGTEYSFKHFSKDSMARALGKSLPISLKQSIEICNGLRNKDVNHAKRILNEVLKGNNPIPFKKFNNNIGHKKGMAAGRFPKKASKEMLDLISQVESNAQYEGLNTSNLVIRHINASKGPTTMRYGRKRSRKGKRTNIEIVVQEKISTRHVETKSKEAKEETKKIEKKTESKIEKKDKAKKEAKDD